jgi:putative peptide zinc metalloprotease protein
MTAPTTSNSWHRVAGLRPQLRHHARLYRHRYRGQVWYLLQDPATGKVHRFTPSARLVIAAMDGQRTVAQLWELANRHLDEEAPTQDDMIQLLGQLHAADLLQSNVTPDTAELFQRGERETKARQRRSWMNPMALRLHLWDPDRFLSLSQPLARFCWSRWGALLWLALVLPALLLLPPHWTELTHNFSDRVLAVDNLLLLWLVFPLIKALHELGHAYATKAGGGEVHDMGLMLLVLMPVPYVEASAATVFRSRYQRALVGAAGMLVELLLAALAFYVWLLAEPGLLRALMFNIMLVAGVSTVLFNGNPLLRYDAYYILADLIEMPNLAQRSLRYWTYLLERYALSLEDQEPPVAQSSEKAWLLFYGLASTIYRIMVTVAIAIFIAGQFFFIGVLLAAWAVGAMVVMPLFKGLRYLFTSPKLMRRRQRVVGLVAGSGLALLLFLLVVPVPLRSQAEGVIWLPEESMVRAGAEGFVQQLLVEPGTRVRRGDALLQSQDLALQAEFALSEARVQELEAEYAAQFVSNLAQAALLREQLLSARAVLERARERVAALTVLAGSDGVFTLPQAQDLLGRHHRKGDVLGYVTDKAPSLARVVVTQAEVDMVRLATDRVEVRLVHDLGQVVEGQLVRQVPAGESRLPSRALSTAGGGQLVVDPQDAQGTRTLERLFQFDVALQQASPQILFGQRVHVRFDHRWEPLAMQWFRTVRRIFLTHFHV